MLTTNGQRHCEQIKAIVDLDVWNFTIVTDILFYGIMKFYIFNTVNISKRASN